MQEIIERLGLQQGEQRLSSLLEICVRHSSLGFDAEKFFDEAIVLSVDLDNRQAHAHLLILFAQHKDLHGAQQHSMQLLNEAMKILLSLSESENVSSLTGEAHFTLGVVNKKLNANHYALNSFADAIATFSRIQHKDGLAKSLIRYGTTLNETGNIDEAIEAISKALKIAEETSNIFRLSNALNALGTIYVNQGNFTLALKHFLRALPLVQQHNNLLAEATLLRNIGSVYNDQLDFDRAEEYHSKALQLYKQADNSIEVIHQLANVGSVLLQKKKYREAKKHLYEAVELADKIGAPNTLAYTYFYLGNVYFEEHNTQPALAYYNKAKAINAETEDKRNLALALNGIANALIFSGDVDGAEPYLLEAIEVTRESQLANEEKDTLKLLSEVRKQQRRFAEALSLFEKHAAQKEALLNAGKIREAEALQTQMAIENKEKEIEIERLRNVELKQAYEQLKSAQNRLIQQEKLASLGQLTAGVAHEIQNPLNFVNNYSDISVELLDELSEATDENERRELIDMLRSNLSSIHKNGSRASGIVKSMLEHSNAGKSERVATDINHLIKEHLQYAQSGFRANNNGFECPIETDFDNNIPDSIIAPSEIGKALLNIFNNALYELQKVKISDSQYAPQLSVTTSFNASEIEIKISDNGGGIADEHKNQIFEPFFTSKPTGEGVGLGLSIANDILQSHDGSITVENNKDKGVSFILKLPIK